MAIYNTLSNISTLASNAQEGQCTFNGYLEDYLLFAEDELGDEWKELFSYLVEIDSGLKVCVGLRLDINPKVVTNRIIRYKDAFKMAHNALVYPFIIYGITVNKEERSAIICKAGKEEYLRAKGLYYCMSEPLGMFENSRNEIVATDLSHAKETLEALFVKGEKTGAIQRRLDNEIIGEYEELKEYALDLSSQIKDKAVESFTDCSDEDKEKIIKETIVMWFLIKKTLYVQYMMSKHILNAVHNGDIKAQRTMAKANADAVVFTSYGDLWKS